MDMDLLPEDQHVGLAGGGLLNSTWQLKGGRPLLGGQLAASGRQIEAVIE